MAQLEITCINKPDRLSAHEHITFIGNSSGRWKVSLQSAIARIKAGSDNFYTVDRTTGRHVPIGVVEHDGNKRPYVRTYADGKWKDNLLALPECGPECRIIS